LWILCVLSGRDACDGPITRPEESYRLWCVWLWSWRLDNEEAVAHWEGCRPLGAGWSWGIASYWYVPHRPRIFWNLELKYNLWPYINTCTVNFTFPIWRTVILLPQFKPTNAHTAVELQ
jgi:hypothetical protein